LGAITVAVVTVSDSRTIRTDENGRYLKKAIRAKGHRLGDYALVKDEPKEIEIVCEKFCRSGAQVIIFNGGTGISPRDTTFDVISRKLDKTLTGFGEIFRMLSYKEIGAAAIMSRATAGTYKGKVLIVTPGSPHALRLAWQKLIQPQLQHLAWELTR
jgi:molybdenum cofactor biosynthesis protein B